MVGVGGGLERQGTLIRIHFIGVNLSENELIHWHVGWGKGQLKQSVLS